MSTKTTIKALDIVGTSVAVSSDDGQKLFEEISKAIEQGEDVEVDFSGIDLIVSTFLNAAIGQLYGKHTSESIKEHVSVKNLSNDDLNILKKVVERAKQYFADPVRFSKAVKKGMDNG